MDQLLNDLLATSPVLVKIYMGLSGAYMIFCAVASFTKTHKDDEIADRLKRFFSLPVKKVEK